MFGFKRSRENGESEKGGAWRVWLIPLGALCGIHRKNLFSARFRYRESYF